MSWEVRHMTIRRWISSGESEQFEDCATERELLDRLGREAQPFRDKLGTLLFVDDNGDIFSVDVEFMLTQVLSADGDDAEVFVVSCEHCLSEDVDECGICLDCGHVNHCPPIPPKRKMTSGRSH